MTATCACGCGEATLVYKGKPRRFVHGHNSRRPIDERFWEKVYVLSPNGCWIWTADRRASGYGRFSNLDLDTQEAHRVAYELAIGPIPPGLHLDHLCLNPPCVNPYHLEPVTQAENNRRGGRTFGDRMEKCRHGHDWSDPNNVATRRNGGRYCKACRRKGGRAEDIADDIATERALDEWRGVA